MINDDDFLGQSIEYELGPLLTTSAEVDVVDVTRSPGDVIEACERDVISAEEARRPAQNALKPASGAGTRQRVAVDTTTAQCCVMC